MEKYGTDLSELPVTDDQIRRIKKMARDDSWTMPKTMEEADGLIEKLAKENK